MRARFWLTMLLSVTAVSGCSDDENGGASSSSSERVQWEYVLDRETYIYYASPAMGPDEERIYFGTARKIRADPSREDALFALNRSGEEEWVFELPDGGEVRSSPVVGAGNVCFLADQREGSDTKQYTDLFCVDADNGEQALRKRVSSNNKMSTSGLSSPVIVGGNVIAVMERLHVFDLQTGGKVYSSEELQGSSDGEYVSPVVNEDGEVLFLLDGSLHVFSPQEPSLQVYPVADLEREMGGEDEVPSGPAKVLSTPALDSAGNLYFGTETGEVFSIDQKGNKRWNRDFNADDDYAGPYVRSSPAIDEAHGAIYVGTKADGDSEVVALNQADGSVRWRYSTGGDVYSSPAIGDNGRLYVGSEAQKVHALSNDGSLVWEARVRQDITWSSPALDDQGILYIGGMGDGAGQGRLVAIETDSTGLLEGDWPKIRGDNQNTGMQ